MIENLEPGDVRPCRGDQSMTCFHFRFSLGVLLAVFGTTLAAADRSATDEADRIIVEDSAMVGPGAAEDGLEPEVTIIETTRGTIQEYRSGGVLYMVKITPRRGLPYYLVDTDGDGMMDMRHNDPTDITIPQWRIYSW